MTESILLSIKKLLNIVPDTYDGFDTDIIIHINTVLMILKELGVGPAEGFSISGSTETWNDYLGDDVVKLAGVKSYIYLKVRCMFDPPTGAEKEAIDKMISELEWRLNGEGEGLV